MGSQAVGIQQRRAARVGGLGLLLMAVAGIFSLVFVLQSLVVPGDTATTAANIAASEGLFRAGIFGILIVLVLDVLVAWALYELLEPVNKGLSLLAAWFRLAYTAIHGIAVLNLVLVLQLIDGGRLFGAFETGQRGALVSLFLDAHAYGFLVGLVFFAFHLLIIGYLTFKAAYARRIMGVLLMIAGVAYLADSTANVLLPNYGDYEGLILILTALPATIGELTLTFWLLYRGFGSRRQTYRSPRRAAA